METDGQQATEVDKPTPSCTGSEVCSRGPNSLGFLMRLNHWLSSSGSIPVFCGLIVLTESTEWPSTPSLNDTLIWLTCPPLSSERNDITFTCREQGTLLTLPASLPSLFNCVSCPLTFRLSSRSRHLTRTVYLTRLILARPLLLKMWFGMTYEFEKCRPSDPITSL